MPPNPIALSVSAIRSTLESTLSPFEQCVYMSHPITTGGTSIAQNRALAAVRVEELRAKLRRQDCRAVVVNPAALEDISGWDQTAWMVLWLPFIKDRVRLLVQAPGWESSQGCLKEAAWALTHDITIMSWKGVE